MLLRDEAGLDDLVEHALPGAAMAGREASRAPLLAAGDRIVRGAPPEGLAWLDLRARLLSNRVFSAPSENLVAEFEALLSGESTLEPALRTRLRGLVPALRARLRGARCARSEAREDRVST